MDGRLSRRDYPRQPNPQQPREPPINVALGRVDSDDFQNEEELYRNLGAVYQPPSVIEDRAPRHVAVQATINRHRRISNAFKRISDPVAHEAFKIARAALVRSRRKSLTPSKRPRDDIDGQPNVSPASQGDGQSNVSPEQGEPMDIEPPSLVCEAGGGRRKDPLGPKPDKHKYEFEEFVEGASKQICEAVEKAKEYDQRFRVDNTNKFVAHACAVCDRIFKGTAKSCFISRADIKSKVDRIGCASYVAYYGDGSLPKLLKDQVRAH